MAQPIIGAYPLGERHPRKDSTSYICDRDYGNRFPATPVRWSPKADNLCGIPKIGKSYMCMGMAFVVASQGIAGSKKEVDEPLNTLYLVLDDPARRIQARICQLAPDGSIPAALHFLKIGDMRVSMNQAGINHFEKVVDQFGAKFVIIDTQNKIRSSQKRAQTAPSTRTNTTRSRCYKNGLWKRRLYYWSFTIHERQSPLIMCSTKYQGQPVPQQPLTVLSYLGESTIDTYSTLLVETLRNKNTV